MFRKILGVFVCTLLLSGTARAEPVAVFGDQVSIGIVPGLNLSPLQEEGLKGFRAQKSYFGAYYVSVDGQAFQHFVNWHDLDKVKRAARTACELISEGSPCTLAAVSVPKGVDPNQPGQRGLGLWARTDLMTYRANQVQGRFGAFAVSSSTHHGFANNWINPEEARAAAIAFCDASVARDMAYLGIRGREIARARGYTKCRVIDETALR